LCGWREVCRGARASVCAGSSGDGKLGWEREAFSGSSGGGALVILSEKGVGLASAEDSAAGAGSLVRWIVVSRDVADASTVGCCAGGVCCMVCEGEGKEGSVGCWGSEMMGSIPSCSGGCSTLLPSTGIST